MWWLARGQSLEISRKEAATTWLSATSTVGGGAVEEASRVDEVNESAPAEVRRARGSVEARQGKGEAKERVEAK